MELKPIERLFDAPEGAAEAGRPKYTLKELLTGMKDGDLPCDQEWDAMPAVGCELGSMDETDYLLSNPASAAN